MRHRNSLENQCKLFLERLINSPCSVSEAICLGITNPYKVIGKLREKGFKIIAIRSKKEQVTRYAAVSSNGKIGRTARLGNRAVSSEKNIFVLSEPNSKVFRLEMHLQQSNNGKQLHHQELTKVSVNLTFDFTQ